MRRLVLFALLALAAPGAGEAQSLLNAGGLGLRVDAKDTRARALGGVSLGTTVPAMIPGQPTAALDLLFPAVAFTLQPSWGDYTLGDDSGDFQGTRFPLIAFAYPVGIRGVITAIAGAAFDQRWEVTREGSAVIDGVSIPTDDRFESDGGVSQLQIGYARRMSSDLAVGLSLGLHRGQVTRTFVRQFDTTAVANPIAPFINGGKWTYFGPLVTVDAQWDPSSVVSVGARVTWGGTLEANPTDDTEGAAREVDVPIEVGAGASLILSPTLSFVLGAETSNWNDLGDPTFDAVASGRTTTLGAGLEWSGWTFWAGALPLRLGARRAQMPFSLDGTSTEETTLSGGLGVVMSQRQGIPLVTLDFGMEFGDRDSGELNESFRRFSLTFRVSGN